jgi:hypothetical protein
VSKELRAYGSWTLGLLAVVLAACGGDSDPTQPPSPTPPNPAITLSVSPDSVVLAPGDTAMLVATYMRPAAPSALSTLSFHGKRSRAFCSPLKRSIRTRLLWLTNLARCGEARLSISAAASG